MKKSLMVGAILLVITTCALAQTTPVDTVTQKETQDTRTYHNFHKKKISDIDYQKQVNPINLLKGQFSGVFLNGSAGSPGASTSVRIRGSHSVLNDNGPLIILDGIPVDNREWGNASNGVDQSNRLIDLNPDDIASVKILKGPNATTLYGLRGGNGVIEIKTKRGSNAKNLATVSSTIFMEQVNKLPERQNTYAQGRPSGGISVYRGPETGEGFSWGPPLDQLEYLFDESYPYDSNGRLVTIGSGNRGPANAYDPYTFFVNGLTYQLNAAVSGSGEKSDYYISAGRSISNGFAPKARFGRNSFAGNLHTELTQKLRLNVHGHFSNTMGYRLQRGSNIQGVMIGLLRTAPTFDNGNGKSGKEAADDPSSYILDDGTQRSYRAGIYDNPYWVVNKNPFDDDVLRVIGNVSLDYDLTDWLTLTGRFGYDQYSDFRKNAFDINPGRSTGSVIETDINYYGLNGDFLASFEKELNDHWSIEGTAGYNYFQSQFRDTTTTGTTLLSTGPLELSNTAVQEGTRTTIRKTIVGLLGQATLNWKDLFSINVSARNDWSSALPEKTGSFLSYAVNGKLNIHNLPGVNNLKGLSLLAINLGYGSVANDAPAHLTQNYFLPATIGGDPFISAGQLSGYEVSNFLGNDHLRPEVTSGYEAGFELGLWQNRLQLAAVAYQAITKDVIFIQSLPASSGFNSIGENGGEISNTGIELDLWINPVKRNNFSWDLGLNFSKNENIVEKVPELAEDFMLSGFTSTSTQIMEGHPYGVIYGDAFVRNESGQLIIDANGWPMLDSDKRILGDPNPDWWLNVSNKVRIGKSLSISALLEIKKGGDMWCGTCGVMNYFGISKQSADERNDTRIFEGVLEDGSPNDIVVQLANPEDGLGSFYRVRYGFGDPAELNIFDAGWIRLRSVGLHYNLSSVIPEKLPFNTLTVSAFAYNLWLKTEYPGIDPETNLTGTSNGFGLDYFNMPGSRSFGVTIKLGL